MIFIFSTPGTRKNKPVELPHQLTTLNYSSSTSTKSGSLFRFLKETEDFVHHLVDRVEMQPEK